MDVLQPYLTQAEAALAPLLPVLADLFSFVQANWPLLIAVVIALYLINDIANSKNIPSLNVETTDGQFTVKRYLNLTTCVTINRNPSGVFLLSGSKRHNCRCQA